MLYVGATLMIGASIYGFVDYKQTSNKKEFTSMYEEKKTKNPVVVEEKTVPVTEKKEVVVAEKKTKPVHKKTNVVTTVDEEVIPAIKPIEADAKITEKTSKNIEEAKVNVKTSEKPAVKKTKKKKLNSKIFSRAPLREEDDVVIEPVKVEPKKTENKEQ